MSTLRRAAALVVPVAFVLAACGSATTSSPGPLLTASPTPAATPSASPAATPAATPSTSRRAVIVDTDLGADDLTALAVLLRDPAIDVRAITVARTGLVHCGPGLQNLRNLLADLGVPETPIGCGRVDAGPEGYAFPDSWRAAADAAYGIGFRPAPATSPGGDAAVVIAAAVATSPAPPLVVALGPWTNVAEALAADPGLAVRIAGIHAMGGTLDAPGNVWAGETPLAIPVEFNFAADPAAVAAVLATTIPVTLVPLDATDDVPVTPAFVAALEADHAAAGADLVVEMYARTPFLAGQGQFLWDQTAAVALLDPTVVTWQEETVGVTAARPDAGRIARDPAGRPIRFATAADPAKVEAALLAALRRGGPRAHPFTLVGQLSVTWDGTVCSTSAAPIGPGLHAVRLVNGTAGPVALLVGGPRPPKTWDDLLAYVADLDPTQPTPDWVVGIASVEAGPGGEARAFADMPAGTFGPFCVTGEGPATSITPGSPFTIPAP